MEGTQENQQNAYFNMKPMSFFQRFFSVRYWLDMLADKYAIRWIIFIVLSMSYAFRVCLSHYIYHSFSRIYSYVLFRHLFIIEDSMRLRISGESHRFSLVFQVFGLTFYIRSAYFQCRLVS